MSEENKTPSTDTTSDKGKWHGGKGSLTRKGSSKKKFDDGWERIFGKNTPSQTAIEIISTVHNNEKD